MFFTFVDKVCLRSIVDFENNRDKKQRKVLVCTKVSLFVVGNRPLPVYISSPFANFCGICTHFSLIFDLSFFSLVSWVTVELFMFVLTIFIDHKSHCLPSAVVCTYTNTHFYLFTCGLLSSRITEISHFLCTPMSTVFVIYFSDFSVQINCSFAQTGVQESFF